MLCPLPVQQFAYLYISLPDSFRRKVERMLGSLLAAARDQGPFKDLTDVYKNLPLAGELQFPLKEVKEVERLEKHLKDTQGSSKKLVSLCCPPQ